jgi:flagellar FliL protein
VNEEVEETAVEPVRKPKSRLLLIACAVAILVGGGGFYTVYSGLLQIPFNGDDAVGNGHAASVYGDGNQADARAGPPPGTFVALDPLVISLGEQSRAKHLKVSLTLEVGIGRAAEVEAIKPRVIDVLNGFLRAVDEREFELPRSMERLRAQMLRRVILVTPEGAVRDLLIQEFVLN